jgi:hypothetical protein
MFGDPYQLPPVLKEGAEKHYLMDNYPSPWFFDSKVWQEVMPRVVELTDVKRQDEAEFRDILDRMRNGAMTSTDGAVLNDIGARRPIPEGTVTLSTTNASANGINAKALRDLPGKTVTAAAIIEGDFGGQLPAEEELELKPERSAPSSKSMPRYTSLWTPTHGTRSRSSRSSGKRFSTPMTPTRTASKKTSWLRSHSSRFDLRGP